MAQAENKLRKQLVQRPRGRTKLVLFEGWNRGQWGCRYLMEFGCGQWVSRASSWDRGEEVDSSSIMAKYM